MLSLYTKKYFFKIETLFLKLCVFLQKIVLTFMKKNKSKLKVEKKKNTDFTDVNTNNDTDNTTVLSKPLFNKTIIIFLVFSFLLYGNTLFNDYALDDAIVITQNNFTKKGLSGIGEIFSSEYFTGFFGVKKDLVAGGRYRPLSVATFAVEYEFFGLNPFISHLINILLYAFIGILLFKILDYLFHKYLNNNIYLSLPFVAVILYLAHPIHTEVVANIKGRDELLSLLGALGAMYYVIKYLETPIRKYLIFIFLCFSAGMFAKESAITFLFTIPLAIWFFVPEKFKFKSFIKYMMPMFVASIIYLFIRHKILGVSSGIVINELMNDSFLGMNFNEKYATIFYTLGLYIKLLFYPHPLTYDYYPYHIPIMNWTNWQVLFSLAINLGLGIWAIIALKKRNLLSFAIIFYFASLSPMSNVLFPIGVFMNERFVFVASLGFALALSYFLTIYLKERIIDFKKYKIYFSTLFTIIIILYSGKTISRNTAWKNDFTLFTTDVKVSGNSAKSTCSAGGKLIEEAKKEENAHLREEYLTNALMYLNKSVSIHPKYTDAWLLMGNAYYEYNKNYDSLLYAYKQILKNNPNYDRVWSNLEIIFNQLDSTDFKIDVYKRLFELNPGRFEANYQLGSLYGKHKNEMEKAIYYLKRASLINPKNQFALKDLGVAYGMSQKYDSSLHYLIRAVELDPKDAQTIVNIGITYYNIGDTANASKYFKQAKQINPNIRTP